MDKRLFIIAAAAVLAVPALSASPAGGLVSRHSANLDHVAIAAAWPGAYQGVYIPPIEVQFQRTRDMNAVPEISRRNTPEDMRRTSQEMAQSLRGALQGALQKSGYRMASNAAPGVLVLKVRLEEVHVNAPDNSTFARTNTYVREAGEARLRIDGFDGASSTPVLAIDDRARARSHMQGLDRANDVTNRFWFDEMFDRWAEGVARELPAAGSAG